MEKAHKAIYFKRKLSFSFTIFVEMCAHISIHPSVFLKGSRSPNSPYVNYWLASQVAELSPICALAQSTL